MFKTTLMKHMRLKIIYSFNLDLKPVKLINYSAKIHVCVKAGEVMFVTTS